MGRRTLAVGFILAGLLLGLGYATGNVRLPFALFIALLLFCVGGMLLPGTYEIANQLRPWLGTYSQVKAWGRGLPDHEGTVFRFDRALALGVGLHLYLQPEDRDKALHLKIAQPKAVVIGDHFVEIGAAKYVQWCGKKMKRAPGEKALVLERAETRKSDPRLIP